MIDVAEVAGSRKRKQVELGCFGKDGLAWDDKRSRRIEDGVGVINAVLGEGVGARQEAVARLLTQNRSLLFGDHRNNQFGYLGGQMVNRNQYFFPGADAQTAVAAPPFQLGPVAGAYPLVNPNTTDCSAVASTTVNNAVPSLGYPFMGFVPTQPQQQAFMAQLQFGFNMNNYMGKGITPLLHRHSSTSSNGTDSRSSVEITLDQKEANASTKKTATAKPKAKRSRVRSSKYRGVSWHKRDKSWIARIWHNSKIIHVGNFGSEKRAALAVDLKLLELQAADANSDKPLRLRRLNFPDPEERTQIMAEFGPSKQRNGDPRDVIYPARTRE